VAPRLHEVLKKRIQRLPLSRLLAARHFLGKVYLVGGAIRELALGSKPRDYDLALASKADLPRIESALQARSFLLGKKPIQTHRIVTRDLSVDVTILEGNIEADLRRRDFTINAVACDLALWRVIDPLEGLADIERRVIRYPEERSLVDDPLRMLKAVRHFASLKDFALDAKLHRAIGTHKDLIRNTAPERIKYELDLIMLSGNPHRAITVLRETGLLFELVPELLALKSMDEEKGFELETLGHTLDGFKYLPRARRFHPFDAEEMKLAAYALLFHDLGKAHTFSYDEEKGRVHFFYHERHSVDIAAGIMERLRFSTAEARAISHLIDQHMRLFLISRKEATERAFRRIVYKMEELTPALVVLTLLDLYGSSGGRNNASTRIVRNSCRQVLATHAEWRKEPLPRLISGRDLLAMGFSEGPALGRVLDEVRERQIAGDITDADAALAYARSALKGTE
jgi:poly(A) polymerase